MNHAITLRDILAITSGLIGLGCAGIGLLMVFAGGMSDAPEDGMSTSSAGCAVTIVGAAFIALCVGLLA